MPQAGHGQVVQEADVKYAVHRPWTHTSLVAHAWPHAPGLAEQWSGLLASCAAVKQPPPHDVRPICWQNVVWQAPSTQRLWKPQALPHEPQFWKSWSRSTQLPAHEVRPGRQAHLPPVQNCGPPQAVPHAPQSVGLLWRSAQPSLHVVPAHEQAPAVQTSPCAQALLQLPQWAGSLAGLEHCAPHCTSPTGQTHWPETHESPVGQALPQAPQWAGSLARLAQPINRPQSTSPVGHWQLPPVQVAPDGQAVPQPPQCAGSVSSLTQP